jgi:hypothetical protein
MLEFTVKQVEGLEDNLSYAGLYITVDSNLVDVITPLTHAGLQSNVKIPSTGRLHLIFKNMREGDKFIGSVSIDLSLVHSKATWLPIFDSLDYDLLQSIPEKIDCPKILIEISSAHESLNQGSFLEKIKSLQLKIMDLEHTLASERWEFQREIGSLSSSQRYREDSQTLIIEQQKIQLEKQEALINDLLCQKNDFHMFKDKETIWMNSLEETIQSIRREYEKILIKSQERDSDYLQKISELSKENFELKIKIERLLNEIFQKDLKISHLKEKNKHMAGENFEAIIKKQREKINSSQEYLKTSEESRNLLQKKIEELIEKLAGVSQCSNCDKNRDMFNELTRQISSLKNLPKDEVKDVNCLSFESFIELDAKNSGLDGFNEKQFKAFISAFEKKVKDEEMIESELKNFAGCFLKIGSGQYLFNKTLKVNVFLENNSVLCRVGKIFTLNEFISSFAQGVSLKSRENSSHFSKNLNETGTCENSWSEEDKKDEEVKKKEGRIKPNLIKAQFKPDKKAFVPLRQTSSHSEKKRLCK